MASAAGQATDGASQVEGGLRRLLGQHQTKMLNVGLLLYLCLGTVLFEQLAELERQRESGKASKPASLGELRLVSARRMWNITNQLNILYESNWTSLVLDELAEFERRLVETLAERRELGLEDEEEKEEKKDEGEDEDDGNKEKRRRRSKRNKSWRKSLVHALATVTTMGSPHGHQPNSKEAKLATVIYGLLGVPLLVVAVTKSGRQLADRSLDSLSRVKHYCYSLPVHYLCCACQLAKCVAWIAWCCCCFCCCSYLCCPKKSAKRRPGQRRRNRRPPKLKLKCQRGRPEGASRPESKHQTQQGYVIESQDQTANLEDKIQEEEPLYSRALFVTSLALLAGYLGVGAYAMARLKDTSLIDSLFACYSMLSMSKLPDSFELAAGLRPIETHKEPLSSEGKPHATQDTFVLDIVYLLVGLNIVAMCSHLARLWLLSDQSEDPPQASLSSLCNGHPPGGSRLGLTDAGLTTHPHFQMSPLEQAIDNKQLNLFVVSQNDNQQAIQTFANQELSLASDGPSGADSRPLCLHHQATAQVSPAGGQTSSQIYGYQPIDPLPHHHHQGYHQTIYLPKQVATCTEDEGERDDELEMERLMQSCLMKNGPTPVGHSSSSSNRLAQQQEQVNGYLNELDSTTNSNTISSTASSRTVKLPPPSIGFVLAPDQLTDRRL